MNLLIGLGNNELRYANTRHNAGFMLVDYFIEKGLQDNNLINKSSDKHGDHCIITMDEYTKMYLYKPNSLMNSSGDIIAKFLKFKSNFERIFITYDDLDIALGRFKITDKKPKTHNGVYSIVNRLPLLNFTNIRIGIDSRRHDYPEIPSKYVLEKFGPQEHNLLQDMFLEIDNDLATKLN